MQNEPNLATPFVAFVSFDQTFQQFFMRLAGKKIKRNYVTDQTGAIVDVTFAFEDDPTNYGILNDKGANYIITQLQTQLNAHAIAANLTQDIIAREAADITASIFVDLICYPEKFASTPDSSLYTSTLITSANSFFWMIYNFLTGLKEGGTRKWIASPFKINVNQPLEEQATTPKDSGGFFSIFKKKEEEGEE